MSLKMSNKKEYKDNSVCSDFPNESLPLMNQSIKTLKSEGVFDAFVIGEFSQKETNIDDSWIFCNKEGKTRTSNIMGFFSFGGVNVKISSRFEQDGGKDKSSSPSEQDGGNDYFLHFLLAKVMGLNVISLPSETDLNFTNLLIYTFPYYLKTAMSQGLYREYRRFYNNDARVRGAIDVARHIKQNNPFRGNIAYTFREHTTNNHITQLVRHTIEYIRRKNMSQVLSIDTDTRTCVDEIIQHTPDYSPGQRRQVIQKNLRALQHPYFFKYRDLQEICMMILRSDDKFGFGDDPKKIQGILFDGAWLWEEYLNTMLSGIGFTHPINKKSYGRLYLFNDNHKAFYPDFYKKEGNNITSIVDAKYKRIDKDDNRKYNINRDDLYQIISYMYATKCQRAGIAYPSCEESEMDTYGELYGYGGRINVYPFRVPSDCNDLIAFAKAMEKSEEGFAGIVQEQNS